MYKSCLNLLCTFYVIRVHINRKTDKQINRQTDKQIKIPKMLEMDSVNYPLTPWLIVLKIFSMYRNDFSTDLL